ncbi:RHO1 GDP-GTP exchange protein 2, partial [Irineochytrium annulatum]
MMTEAHHRPALLSEVASVFLERVPLGTHVKNGIEYPSTFLGCDAVDAIADILQSKDRNLALLVGRCLERQGLLVDVASAKRLRDTDAEVYRADGDIALPLDSPERAAWTEKAAVLNGAAAGTVAGAITSLRGAAGNDWWSTTVPTEVVSSVTKEEEKRQNAIYDIIKTERNFVEELKAIQTMYVMPLRNSDIFEEERKEMVMRKIFLNSAELLTVNAKLLQKLLQRQQEAHIVDKIGDIFVNIASEFFVYVDYCGNREYSRHDIALERSQNPKFKEFLTKAIAKTDSRAENKQELDGYLHKPIARMASYLLLLKAILDKTPEGHQDRTLIPQAMKSIAEVLAKMNEASGQSINTIKLLQLTQLISHEPNELRLKDPDRQYIYEGKLTLKKPGGGDLPLTVFLFDHVLLLTREKGSQRAEGDNPILTKKGYQYVVYKKFKPIPLEVILPPDRPLNRRLSAYRSAERIFTKANKSPIAATAITNAANAANIPALTPNGTVSGPTGDPNSRVTFTLTALGRTGGQLTFQSDTESGRNTWRETIERHRARRVRAGRAFEHRALASVRLPAATCRVNCAAAWGDRLVLGTDHGIYLGPEGSLVAGSDEGEPWERFERVVEIEHVAQVDILRDHDLVIVLSDKTLLAFPADLLDVGG